MSEHRLISLPALAHFLAITPPPPEQRGFLCCVKNEHTAEYIKILCELFAPQKTATILINTPDHLFIPKNTDILITTAEMLTAPVENKSVIQAKKRIIVVGETVRMPEIAAYLAVQGFKKENTATAEPLTFSIKGDAFSFWAPFENYPTRLHFFGDTIESMEYFDPETKKKNETLTKIELPQNIRRKDTKETFSAKLLDQLPDYTFITEEHLPKIKNYSTPPFYLGSEPTINADKKKYSDFRVWVATNNTERVRYLWPKASLFTRGAQTIGFIHTPSKTLFLTDRHLFGKKQSTKTFTHAKQVTDLADIQENSYVVHLHHGIGRYVGLKTITVEGKQREYAHIAYAGNDKLFVPVDQLDRIELYVGSDTPKLHPLSGNTWNEALLIAKKDTAKLASELLNHYARRTLVNAPELKKHAEERELAATFPHELTTDQNNALQEILLSLAEPHPVDHLLCGDVGFGKTELAIRAGFRAVMNGYQVAVLAPTTILAQQHFDTFTERMQIFGVNIGLLSRWQKPNEQKNTLENMLRGTIDMVIGTHRLLSKDVHFKKLGLLIIDEEQRFGVEQKEKIVNLKKNIHVLTLSATPIPRTLHLSLSGLRPVSYIQTPPPGRKSIETIIQKTDENTIRAAINFELKRQGQVYLLYNHVSSIERRAHEIRALAPQARIETAHGQMKDTLLAARMHDFDAHKIDVLVCSTIIENGLDLPGVNTLIVENVGNFGLSQLYQLRGRIGRGHVQAHAYFLYNSKKLTEETKARLTALEEAQTLGAGFEIAKRDLEIRGVGNILGKKQHGHVSAIGLNLYTRLLAQAVHELEYEEEVETKTETTLHLPLTAIIPESFEPNTVKRMNLYKKLNSLESKEELRTMKDHYLKKNPPGEFKNLFKLLEIKYLAIRHKVISIDTQQPNDINNFPSPRIVIKTTQPIPYKTEFFDWKKTHEKEMKIFLHELGDDWMEKLKKTISYL